MGGMSDGKMVLCLLILFCTAAVNSETEKETAPGDEKEITQDDEKKLTEEDKAQCVKKFVEWCNNMPYPQEGVSGLALLSVSYNDDENYYRVLCSSDSDGTNCSRNGSPWFSCGQDHVLTYKGKVLTETTTDIDNDICKSQEKAFKDLFVHNMSYDNSTLSVLEKELKSFFKEILAMHEQIYEVTKKLGDGSFMGDDFWKGFGDFSFKDNEEDTETMKTSDEKKDTNQIERE